MQYSTRFILIRRKTRKINEAPSFDNCTRQLLTAQKGIAKSFLVSDDSDPSPKNLTLPMCKGVDHLCLCWENQKPQILDITKNPV